MTYKLTTIISGGAVGAERGAIRAAIDLDLNYGGWSWHEDNVPDIYVARSRPAVSRALQRRLNVQDSDGTLFVLRVGSKPMKFIVDACKQMRKPAKQLLLQDGHGTRIPSEVHASLLRWIDERRISILNVVGDADEEDAYDAIRWIFEERASDPVQAIADASGESMNGFDALIQLYNQSIDGNTDDEEERKHDV